jgi:hypothetical protein
LEEYLTPYVAIEHILELTGVLGAPSDERGKGKYSYHIEVATMMSSYTTFPFVDRRPSISNGSTWDVDYEGPKASSMIS